jgi:hypothetical protein
MARVGKSGLVHLDTHIVCWQYEGRSELLVMGQAVIVKTVMVDWQIQEDAQ